MPERSTGLTEDGRLQQADLTEPEALKIYSDAMLLGHPSSRVDALQAEQMPVDSSCPIAHANNVLDHSSTRSSDVRIVANLYVKTGAFLGTATYRIPR